MDYQDLPVEERISRAAEYAVLLVADNKDSETIVSELKPMFLLTTEEAWQAYHQMREKHAEAYRDTIKTNNYNLLGGIIAGSAAALLYFFMGADAGKNGVGIGSIILAILAGLGVLGSLGLLLRNLLERYRRPKADNPLPPKLLGAGNKGSLPAPAGIVMLGAFLTFLGTVNYYMKSGIVDQRELVTLPPQVLWKKPWEQGERSKNKTYYSYYFSFYENPHLYQFKKEYYHYRIASYSLSDLEKGDTIAIQLSSGDQDLVNERYTSHTIDIYNTVKNGVPYVDHASRNRNKEAGNKKMLRLGWIAFVLCLVIAAIWTFFRKRRYRRLTGSRTNTKA